MIKPNPLDRAFRLLRLERRYGLPDGIYNKGWEQTEQAYQHVDRILGNPNGAGYVHSRCLYKCEDCRSDEDISPHHYNITM